MSLAQAIREVSWDGGLSRKSQQSPVVSWPAACPPNACPLGAASRGLPTFPFVMCRDGGPELVIRGEHPWLVSSRRAVPVLPRPGHVRAATALGRSARKQRNRFGTEITHCRTGTGGMTWSTRCAAVCAIRRPLQEGQTPRPLRLATGRAGHPWPRPAGQLMGTPRVSMAANPAQPGGHDNALPARSTWCPTESEAEDAAGEV